jgi:hypothetical protein
MPLRPNLLADIQNALGQALTPSLTAASAATDLYEAYLFSVVIGAARAEGATGVTFRSRLQINPTVFIFRTSPGYLSSTAQDYGYAEIEFQGKPVLEAHLGVRVAGASAVLHECDVCVLLQEEANVCRNSLTTVAPRSSRVVLSVEAKFYAAALGLNLGREFLGFLSDTNVDKPFFVFNRMSVSIEKLLSHKDKLWEHNISPLNPTDVERLRNAFQTGFKDFKAKY